MKPKPLLYIITGVVSKQKKKKNTSSPRNVTSDPHYREKQEIGYLKLQREVENCQYKDVHVLWNLLSQKRQQQNQAAVAAPPSSLSSSSSPSPSPCPSPSPPPSTTTRAKKHLWTGFLCSAKQPGHLVLSD